MFIFVYTDESIDDDIAVVVYDNDNDNDNELNQIESLIQHSNWWLIHSFYLLNVNDGNNFEFNSILMRYE